MKGNVTNTGYWPDSPDRNNDFNIIPSNEITMEGMDMPLMGISNTGDKKLMLPGKNYKFKGETVMETPLDKGIFLGAYKQVGGQLVPHDISVPNLSRQDGGGLESIFKQMMPTYGSQPSVIEQVKAMPNQMLEGMNNKEYNPSEEYMKALMLQENENNAGLRDNKYYPYDSVEGGTPTIGYGHKLTEAEVKAKKYSSGLTKEEVDKLMRNDLNRHKTVAQSSFEKQYGKGSFNKLPNQLKDLVVDYSYTGTGIDKFPSFHKSVYEYSTANDPSVKQAAYNNMLAQHKRYTKGQELVKRNAYTEQVLKNLKQEGGPAKRFNTKLRGQEAEAFNQHAQQFPSLTTDTGDYDTQGFYKEVYNKNNGDMNAITAALTPGSPTAHVGNDRYKKPNHPTFSKESKYHIPVLRPAGEWGRNDQGDYFNASRRNIKNMTESDGTPLEYFKRAEDYNQNGVPDTQLLYRGKSMFNTDAPAYELPEMKPSKLEYSGGGSVKKVKIKSLPNNWKTQ